MWIDMLRLFAMVSSLIVAGWAQQQGPVEFGWQPVTDAERAQKEPLVEKTAGAEAIFWREHIWDEFLGQDWQRQRVVYVRLKIFNEEGKKAVSSIDLPFRNNVSIEYVEGRTIKADGTVVPLAKQDVRERDVIRMSGLRVRAKSFSMPAVEAGSIVEYKYREIQFKQNIRYMRANMQQEYPVQKITYFVKPLGRDTTSLSMRVWPFNCQPSKLQLERDGFNSTTVENVPAFKEEPLMPGEANVRPWVLFLYMEDGKREPAKYWEKTGKENYNEMKASLRLNDEIKAAAAQAVGGAKDDRAKVEALIRYLRKSFRGFFDARVSEAERAKVVKSLPKNRRRTSVEVFASGIGFDNELNTLFAAMAQSVGLEARPVFVASREDIVFNPGLADDYFLSGIDMAVKLNGEWKMFDVGARTLPPHMISWKEEGMQALLSDPKTPVFISTPLSPPEDSLADRYGKLALREDGTLEGEVTEHYTGHAAGDRRQGYEGQTPEKRVETLKDTLLRVYPGAEITAMAVENVEETTQPLRQAYRIRIPNYAQRTGRRLLFSPFVFQQGAAPRFSASQRKFDIQFPYAFTENDMLTIALPEGYELDNAENPGGLDLGAAGKYFIRMSRSPKNELVLQRNLIFGKQGAIEFPAEVYPRLKRAFDEIHKKDGTILSLRQAVKK
jgi:hypothetical protein